MAKTERPQGPAEDIWSQWLLRRRAGGSPEQMQRILKVLEPIREKVLDRAALQEGDVLLDVGCGDGLIGFGALARTERGQVIFCDISPELLAQARAVAREAGLLERCRFLEAPAQDLSPLADASVDVVTTRSVLIYVREKARAFQEFHRVLQPGGRLSLFEPVHRHFQEDEPGQPRFGPYRVAPVAKLAEKVKAVYRRRQPPEGNPMLDFDEWDLLRWAQEAGFSEVHLELRVDVQPLNKGAKWDVYRLTAPNPRAPTLQEAMDEALSPAEQTAFTAHLRPLVEAGKGVQRLAMAYLWARKTGD